MAHLADWLLEISSKLVLEQVPGLEELQLPTFLTLQPEPVQSPSNSTPVDNMGPEDSQGNNPSDSYETMIDFDSPPSMTSRSSTIESNLSYGSTKASKQSARLHCQHPGCTKDFSRASDRDRHNNSIHKDNRSVCGCCKNQGQGQEPRRYRVPDKIHEHLRKKHGLSTQCGGTRCESAECKELTFSSKACLALHKRKDHNEDNSTLPDGFVKSPSEDSGVLCSCADELQSATSTVQSSGSVEPSALEPPIKRIKGPNFSSNKSLSTPSGLCSYWSDTFSGLQSPMNDIIPTNSLLPTSYSTPAFFSESDFAYSPYVPLDSWAVPLSSSRVEQAAAIHQTKTLRDSGNISSTGVTHASVDQVQPADFAVMHALKLFTAIEDSLMLSPDNTPFPNVQCITYNVRKNSLTLRGNPNGMAQAMDLLKKNLQFISERQGLEFLTRSSGHRRSGKRGRFFNFTRSTSSKASQQTNNEEKGKVFAFHAQENPDEFKTWKDVLMPELPAVLNDFVGRNYCACLIRLGADEFDAEPCVQIETIHPLGPETQRSIFARVQSLVKLHKRQSIQIVFAPGSFVQLGLSTATGYSSLKGEDKGRYQFSYNRPWPRPGMGAAVGMRYSDNISGSLGGFLQIKDKLCILTCAHMVSEAWNEGEANQQQSGRKELVSPPQDVLDYLDEWLRTDIHEGRAIISKDLAKLAEDKISQGGDGDIAPEELGTSFTTNQGLALMNKDDIRWQFRSQADNGPVVIGTFLKKREQPRESGTLRRTFGKTPGIEGKVFVDWAVHEAKIDGTNRHRFQSADDAWMAMEPGSSAAEGHLCEDTCDPSDDADVHYVGRTSGHRKCVVNSAPMICDYNGYKFNSWFALQSGKTIDDREVQGDSGSWLIRDSDNKVLGQLIGWCNGKLIFTPINDIIDHIKEICGTEEVYLPRRTPEVPPNPMAQMQTLSCRRPPKNLRSSRSELLTPPPSPSASCKSNTPSLSSTVSRVSSPALVPTEPSTPSSLATTDSWMTFPFPHSKHQSTDSAPSLQGPLWQLNKAIQYGSLSYSLTVSYGSNSKYLERSNNAQKCDLSYILNNSEQLDRFTSVLKKPAETLLSMIKQSSFIAVPSEPSTRRLPSNDSTTKATSLRSVTASDRKKGETTKPLTLGQSWLLNEPLSSKIPRVQTI
ncbi:hypothetical protein MMC10_003252 [Thelotrema lepadinum]|nr:hypothetical protein [Thelotrema lepadinum]